MIRGRTNTRGRVRAMRFVDAADMVPGLLVEMRYAGWDNLFGAPVYPLNRAFLRAETAFRLRRAALALAPLGFRLKVWDAYRPRAVQSAMWERLPDPRFVAHPRYGSRHNRGAAVDVTLADAAGRDLPMPTDFDDFSERARCDWPDGTPEERAHRDLLRRVMTAAGFRPLAEEWWHFDDPHWRRYPVANRTLESLAGE